MGKTSKWLKSLLTGKKEREKEKEKGKDNEKEEPGPLQIKNQSAPIPVPSPKEKKRWSFRRTVVNGKDVNSVERSVSAPAITNRVTESELGKKRHAVAEAVSTAAAADAAAAAAQAAAAVVRLTASSNGGRTSKATEENAAIKIQAYFRSYLARKALCALRGLVKLQALVRGELVRRQANETLRRMQALVTAQARARAQRIQMAEEAQVISKGQPNYRRSPSHPRFQQSYEMEKNREENIKIVEMDIGDPRCGPKGRNSYSSPQSERMDHRHSVYYYGTRVSPSKTNIQQQYSPSPSALTDISEKACSGHFEEFSFATAQSSPQFFPAISMSDSTHGSIDYPLFPNYMSNTESSRAKARSQSAPRQRQDQFERQSSRRRPSIEGRNISIGVKMQRSSSQIGFPANGYQFPWHLRLDQSNMSLKDSECGSTSTVLTNINYCRSLAAYEVYGNKY